MNAKNQRLNATITIGSVLEASVKRNVGFLKTGLNEVGKSIKDVERRQKELDRQRNVLRRQGESVEHLDREYEKLERTMNDLRRAQERWNRAATASRRVGSTFNTMVTDIGRNARRFAIGASIAGGAVFGLASSTAKLGDDVAKTADKLNIGIEELQELRFAAERSGVATASFDTALEKMTRNIGLALEGTGAQKDALDALGLSAADLATMLPEEALGVIADRMAKVETQAERAAIASDIFGRSGIGMLNMLRGGTKGLDELRAAARRTGYVLSEEAARDAEVFQDTLLDTQLTLKGLKNTVGAELMPVVTNAMGRIGDALVGNRAAVKLWAEDFADGVERIMPLVGELATGLGRVGSVIWSVTEGTAKMVGGWENFGIAIGAVLATGTVVKIAKFGSAVFRLGRAMFALSGAVPLVVAGIRAIGLALVANPIGAAIAAIAGGAVLIYQNWDTVGPWFKKLWGDVETYFKGFGDFIGGVFTGDVKRAGSGLVNLWKGYKGALVKMVGAIGEGFRRTYDTLIKPVMDAMGATDAIGRAWESTKAALDPVLTWIGDKFERLMTFIKPVIEALTWVVDKGVAATSAIGSAFDRSRPTERGSNPRSGRAVPLTKNALGGPYQPGWHLTGEKGPELKFENRSGYVANNRAMRQLAGYADSVGALMGSGTARHGSMMGRQASRARTGADTGAAARIDALVGIGGTTSPRGAGAAQPVTQHITYTINAAGASAEEVIRLVERKSREAAGNGLFDRTPATGPFGR